MLVDTHCHLHDPAFADLGEVLAATLAAGVGGIVAVGTGPAANAATLEAAARAPRTVSACLGYHPDLGGLGAAELDLVEAQIVANHARLAGLGEIGLPWYSLDGDPDAAGRMANARACLDRLLGLARRFDLPVALHAPHGAAQAALAALVRARVDRAVFHWHKAPPDVTRGIVAAGYLVSVGPEVVYRERDRELVATVPLEALVVESDGPWPYTGEFAGRPSGPWLAARVAEEVAKIKRVPVDEASWQLGANACRLFELTWA